MKPAKNNARDLTGADVATRQNELRFKLRHALPERINRFTLNFMSLNGVKRKQLHVPDPDNTAELAGSADKMRRRNLFRMEVPRSRRAEGTLRRRPGLGCFPGPTQGFHGRGSDLPKAGRRQIIGDLKISQIGGSVTRRSVSPGRIRARLVRVVWAWCGWCGLWITHLTNYIGELCYGWCGQNGENPPMRARARLRPRTRARTQARARARIYILSLLAPPSPPTPKPNNQFVGVVWVRCEWCGLWITQLTVLIGEPGYASYRLHAGWLSDSRGRLDSHISGLGISRDNPPEARAIVEEVKAIPVAPQFVGRTIGVVTQMGNEQASFIDKLMQEHIQPKDVIERKISVGEIV